MILVLQDLREMRGRLYDVLTFDCYGTLVDWENGIVSAFEDLATAVGSEVDRARVLGLYAEIEPQVEAERYRRYREVLQETSARICERIGIAVPAGEAGFLPRSLPAWPVFADTVPSLRRLRAAGVRLGILSNVDDDLLAATRERLEVDFEFVVTAERVRSYKPASGHFDAARSLVGDRRWLHVAQSLFHDIVPATRLGIPAAWINRKDEPLVEAARPLYQCADLSALADLLVTT